MLLIDGLINVKKRGVLMEKYLVKEFASEIVEQSKGRISTIDAEALAIVYIAKMKSIQPPYSLRKKLHKLVNNL